jgi:hypothetical protein
VVHDRRRQPQHALLNAVEDREIELWLGDNGDRWTLSRTIESERLS